MTEVGRERLAGRPSAHAMVRLLSCCEICEAKLGLVCLLNHGRVRRTLGAATEEGWFCVAGRRPTQLRREVGQLCRPVSSPEPASPNAEDCDLVCRKSLWVGRAPCQREGGLR